MKKRKKSQHPQTAAARPSPNPAKTVVPADVPSAQRAGPISAPSNPLAKIAAIFFGVAVVLALYLAWQSATGNAVAGCGPQSGCSQVLNSRFGYILGLPVSLLGAAAYAFLLVAALGQAPPTESRLRWERGVSVLVWSGAFWFVSVQAVVIKAFCPWCCTTHLLASLGAILLWRSRRTAASAPSPAAWGAFALPMAAVVGLAILQSMSREPERIQQRVSKQAVASVAGKISLHDGRIQLDPASLPVIGETNAAMIAVAITDFTCPHCRELHRTLHQLADQRPGQFSTVMLPGAYEAEATELHRIMLALWRIDRQQYRTVADGLLDGSIEPNVKNVLDVIQKPMNGRFYELAWAQAGWVQETMRVGEELLALNRQQSGVVTLPQVMIRDQVLSGTPHLETLANLIDGKAAPSVTGTNAAEVAAANALEIVPAPAAASLKPRPTSIDAPNGGIAAGSGSAGGQPTSPNDAVSSAPGTGAGIKFQSTTVDLGTVVKGDVVTNRMFFTNSGNAPLTLKNIKAGCGCTTIAGWEQTVAPGKEGSFVVRVETANFAGKVTKTVDVESNATNGMVRVSMDIDIWTPVKLSTTVLSFGTVIKGTPVAPRDIDITVTDSEPLKIAGASCSNPYFKTEFKTIEEGRLYRVTVSVPELGDRPQNGDIVLALGHPKMKEMKVSAFINAVDPLVVQPNQIMISAAQLQTNSTATVTIYLHDTSVLKLEVTDLAYSGRSDVGLKFELKGDERWGTITLSFPAGINPEEVKDSVLSFHTNHPKYPEIKVPLRVLGMRTAVNQASPITAPK